MNPAHGSTNSSKTWPSPFLMVNIQPTADLSFATCISIPSFVCIDINNGYGGYSFLFIICFHKQILEEGKSAKSQCRWLCNAESYVEGQISECNWSNMAPSDPDLLITSHHLCHSLTFVTTSHRHS